MMLELASEFPQWRDRAGRVRLTDVSAASYYGPGYQDMTNRRPAIDKTSSDLKWTPVIAMESTLRRLFEFYAAQLAGASDSREGIAAVVELTTAPLRDLSPA